MHQRLLSLTRNARLPLFLTVLTGLSIGLLAIWQAWLLSTIINAVFMEGQLRTQVASLLWLLVVPMGIRALLTWINEISAKSMAVRIKSDIREKLYTQITRLGPAFARRQRTGELTTSIVEGVEALDAYFSQYLPQLVITTLVPISILLFVFPSDWLSGIILTVTAPLIPLFMVLIGTGAESVTKRQYDTLRTLSASFLDSLQGLTTLKVFGRSRAQTRAIARASEQYRDTTLGVLRITFLSAFALELLATLSTAIIAVEIGFRLLYGRMDFQPALFLLLLAPEFYMPLRALGARFHAGRAGTTAARRTFEILDTPEAAGIHPEDSIQRKGEISSIVFEEVSFRYPGQESAALEEVSLTIRRGQHIALVGRSGAGKSTFVNLLLGFLRPTSGSILTHTEPGNHAREQATSENHSLLDQIAWVPQEPYLFHDTIAANIRLGNTDAARKQIIEAAQAARLHEFIETLPQKYDTTIGEGGARLSSGQAQRLALARAYLKNSNVLVLDEPTSSLDPETETLLEATTRDLMRGKTVITIAHRLNTVFLADQIYVFDHGRIVEQGTHSQLIAKAGAYTKMVHTSVISTSGVGGKGTERFAPQIDHTGLQAAGGSGAVEAGQQTIPVPQPASRHHPTVDPGPRSGALARLLAFLHGSWERVALSVLLGTLTIGSNVALMGTSAWLISTAALQPSVADLGVAVVGVRFFGISRAVFRYLERLVSHDVTFHLLSRLRVWFYEKLEPLAPARLIDYRAGDLLARIVGDVETLENFYVRVLSPPLVTLISAAATATFLAVFHPSLAAVLLGSFLILGILLPLSALSIGRKPGREAIESRAALNARLVDGIQGLADLLAYGRADAHHASLTQSSRAYGRAQMRMAVISGFHNGLAVLCTNLGLWLVVYLTIPLVVGGKIAGPMLAALALLTLSSFEAVATLPLAAQLWESLREAAGRLFEIVDSRPQIAEDAPGHRRPWKAAVTSDRVEAVEFSHLSFRYPVQDVPVLEDISFTVEPGKSVAIVGPSGAGKSTLTNLLLRFWEYHTGDILVGGTSLHHLAPEDVRAQCAVVTQRVHFFNSSIQDNLRLARPKARKAEMVAAARQAGIHDFISGLPAGYDTIIGEQGNRLSGGERQRLAIARVLLKDAPILILDEPTANLDTLTEKQIMETLFKVMAGKTSLLITHRLVGLEAMDEILVMVAGRIVERGKQAKLLSAHGWFRRLWDLQNRYLDNESLAKTSQRVVTT